MLKFANLGVLDRALRLVIGAILIFAPYFYASAAWENPLIRWAIPIIGLVLMLTAAVRFCPIYWLIGTNTAK